MYIPSENVLIELTCTEDSKKEADFFQHVANFQKSIVNSSKFEIRNLLCMPVRLQVN